MDCEPEELQHLSVVGIYGASASILRGPHRPLFARIAAAFALPLAALFLLHIVMSYALFASMETVDSALERSAPGSAAQRGLVAVLREDWEELLLFKAFYLVFLLLFSLLAVAATVFAVASVYSAKHDALSFPKVLSVVPRVWRRLAETFAAAFALLAAYHAAFIVAFVAVAALIDSESGFLSFLGKLLGVPAAVAYLFGLVYVSVVWHLASVVSVLEDLKAFAALRKSRELVRGKLPTAAAVFISIHFVFGATEFVFRKLVVEGSSDRILLAFLLLAALSGVIMLALVTQTLLYLVCKSHQHESIDKTNIADHLDSFLGDYVPLKANAAADVQMENFQV